MTTDPSRPSDNKSQIEKILDKHPIARRLILLIDQRIQGGTGLYFDDNRKVSWSEDVRNKIIQKLLRYSRFIENEKKRNPDFEEESDGIVLDSIFGLSGTNLRKFLNSKSFYVQEAIDLHHRLSNGLNIKPESSGAFNGLFVTQDGKWQLTRVEGGREDRKKAHQNIKYNMPGCCVGSDTLQIGNQKAIDYYLDKPDTEIYTLQAFQEMQDLKRVKQDGPNGATYNLGKGNDVVCFEFNKKTGAVVQIERKREFEKDRTKLRPEEEYALSFLETFLFFIKEMKLRGTPVKLVKGLEGLEAKYFFDKVITRSGEILPKESVPEPEILFPTPIFGEIINVEYPRESKTTPQDFLKSREQKYLEAGIYQVSEIFEEVKMENGNSPLTTLKSLELEERSNDMQIASRLGIQCQPDGSMTPQQEEANKGKIFTLKEIQTLIEMQMGFDKEGNINKGYLKTDYKWNVFYVKGFNNKLRSFYCYWDSVVREWCVDSHEFGSYCNVGRRVFSRN